MIVTDSGGFKRRRTGTACLRNERGHVEVAERGQNLHVGRDLAEHRARTRVGGKDHALIEAAEAVHDSRQPLGPDVGLAVDRRSDVPARLELVPAQRLSSGRGRSARAGKAASAITSPTTSIAAGNPFAEQRLPRAVVRGEEQRGDGVHRDPVVLLGHREVTAAQARLDVRDRHGGVAGGLGAGERRVRVPVDERPVGPLLREDRGDLRAHRLGVGGVEVEVVARLGQPELLVEDVGEVAVPVLAGAEADLLDPGFAQRGADRTGLDELRAVPDDREDFHPHEATMAGRPGR